MMIRLGMACLLLLLPRIAAGREDGAPRSPVLSGTVLEKGTGDPVEGVRVSIEGSAVATETDAQGRYRLSVPPGQHRIWFRCPGFVPYAMRFLFKTQDVALPPIFLVPAADQRPAMVVVSRRNADSVNLEVLLPDEFTRAPAVHGDPIRAIENYPNVSRPKFLDGALVVRGAEPANTVVLVEGHRVPFLYHFGVWKSVINPYFIQSIHYYPGGMPSNYGNVLQAVLDVQPRDLPVDRAHGIADVNATDSALTLMTPLFGGRAALGAAGRFSYLSLLLLGGSALAGTDAILFPRYSDYQVRLTTRALGGAWSVLFLGARDAVRVGAQLVDSSPETLARLAAYGVDPQVPYSTRFHHVHLNYQRDMGKGLFLRTSFQGGWEQEISQLPLLDFFNTALPIPSLTRMDRWSAGNRTELTRRDVHLDTMVGWEARLSRAAITDLTDLWASPDTPVPAPEIKPVLAISVYGKTRWRPRPGWKLIPELRATWYRYNGRSDPFLEPRATVRHGLTRALLVKAAAGLFSQLPDERLYSRQGNPDLSLMKAVQTSAGVEVDLRRSMQLESTVFASRMWHLTLSDLDLVYQDVGYTMAYQPIEVYFQGDGLAYGGEVSWRLRNAGGVNALVSYAYTRSLRAAQNPAAGGTTSTKQEAPAPNGEAASWIPGDYDQPHTLSALLQWPLPRRWTVSARYRLGSGQPYTPFDCAWNATFNTYYPLEGAQNSARSALFHQLDVRVDRTILKDRWRMNFYVDVSNVYNAKNPIMELPNWNCSAKGSSIWIPVVPAVGVKGEF